MKLLPFKFAALSVVSIVMSSGNVWAQSLPPETPVTLSLTIAKADKIWRGLRKLPVEEVEELMNEIRQQVATQTQPKVEPKPENPPDSDMVKRHE